MAFEISDGTLHVEGQISAEDVDDLVDALDGEAGPKRVDLAKCEHLHTAGVQLLMRRGLEVVAWPEPTEWSAWVRDGVKR